MTSEVTMNVKITYCCRKIYSSTDDFKIVWATTGVVSEKLWGKLEMCACDEGACACAVKAELSAR